MLKKLLLIAIPFIALSCSMSPSAYDVDAKGEFYYVGSAPNTQLVFKDNDGMYEVNEEYSNCIGFLMHVQGDLTGESGIYGKCLDILYAEVVQ